MQVSVVAILVKNNTELTRLCDKGYIVKFNSWKAMSDKYHGDIVSKLAAIAE